MPKPEIAYVKNKRELVSMCNLCWQTKKMSWDHVPPKGGVEFSKVEMQSVLNKMSPDHPPTQPKESQDGLKYRTICRECNSMMGRLFDPVINEFAIGVGRLLKSSLTLPPVVQYRTKPANLIRGILGHIVAAKVAQDNFLLDERVRDFLFDPAKPVHEKIHIYYWVYPYSDTLVMRDFMRGSSNPAFHPAFCNLIKYFPIAYLITDHSDYEGLSSLTAYRHLRIDEEAEISIKLTNIKQAHWPEHPQDDTMFILAGKATSDSIRAVRRH